jgi:hypothetical protein
MKKNAFFIFIFLVFACEKTPIDVKADFTFSINFTSITFNNLSENATDFEWTFGDGTSDTQVSPTHIFPKCNATYDVTLIAKNKKVRDTATQKIYCPCDLTKVAGTYLFSGEISCYNPINTPPDSKYVLKDSTFQITIVKEDKLLIAGDKKFYLSSTGEKFLEFRYGLGSNYGSAYYKIGKDSLFINYRSGGIAAGCSTSYAGKKQ